MSMKQTRRISVLLTGDTKEEIFHPSGSRDFAKCYIRTLKAISKQENIEVILATNKNKLKRLFYLITFSRKSAIIHCLTAGKDVFLAYVFSRLWNKPLILSVHGHLAQEKDGASFNWRKRLYYFFYNKLLCQSDALIFPSPYLLELVYENVRFDKYKCFVIPNGVEEEYITEARVKPLGSKIGIFGVWSKIKGIERLQNLIEMAHKYNLHVMWVGVNNFQQSPHNPYLYLMPPVSREKVFELIDDCVVVAVPSLTESFSLVALQAMARGVPVLVSDKVGISSLVASYKAGIVTDFDCKSQLDEDLKRILENYATYSSNAIRCARENSWITVVKRFLDVYKIVLIREDTLMHKS